MVTCFKNMANMDGRIGKYRNLKKTEFVAQQYCKAENILKILKNDVSNLNLDSLIHERYVFRKIINAANGNIFITSL